MFAHLRVTRGNESIFQFKVYGSVSYPRKYCNIYASTNRNYCLHVETLRPLVVPLLRLSRHSPGPLGFLQTVVPLVSVSNYCVVTLLLTAGPCATADFSCVQTFHGKRMVCACHRCGLWHRQTIYASYGTFKSSCNQLYT